MGKNLKLASFNTANLVLPETVYYRRESYSREEYDKKIAWISGQLQMLQADVVAFQEVFHREALEEAIQQSGVYSEYYLAMDEHKAGKSPCSAVLSRYPILSQESLREFPEHSRLRIEEGPLPVRYFRHPVLHAVPDIPGIGPVDVFSVHLKSKRPIMEDGHHEEDYDTFAYGQGQARSLLIRTAEAVALRLVLSRVMEQFQRPVILMGDLNDSIHSVTSTIIAGEMPQRRFSPEAQQQVMSQILFSTYFMQARNSDRDVFFSHIHNGHHENLDHILLSAHFHPANTDRIGNVEYMKTYNDHLIDDTLTDEEIPAWLSDHAQVLVSIDLLKT